MSGAGLADLNSGDRAAFVAALGHLFEHSPWVAAETFDRRPFCDAAHLQAELCATMRRADRERRLALIRAHPDLAERMGGLTAASQGEQSVAGLDRLGEAEQTERQQLLSSGGDIHGAGGEDERHFAYRLSRFWRTTGHARDGGDHRPGGAPARVAAGDSARAQSGLPASHIFV